MSDGRLISPQLSLRSSAASRELGIIISAGDARSIRSTSLDQLECIAPHPQQLDIHLLTQINFLVFVAVQSPAAVR